MNLRILHTNDIHSCYENFSKIVSKIESLRDQNTILLDAGDFADFKRIELQGTGGLAALALLEYAGYDAVAVGNNETFCGVDTLSRMAGQSKVPFLSCNLYRLGSVDIAGVRRSVIIERKGLRILIIGTSPDLGEFNTLMGLEIKAYIEAIREEILRNAHQYDVCILLSHSGLKENRTIAAEIDEIDLIIGGHTHVLMSEPEIIRDKAIHIAGCYGENLGCVELQIHDGQVTLLEAKNINVAEMDACKAIVSILAENKEKALDCLSQPLYELGVDLWHDVLEENPITNLLADALRDVFQCDMGLINSGILNGGVRKGAVSDKKLIDICPSPLNPACFEIQGKHIKEALQNALDSDFCFRDGRGSGFRGKYLGRLHISNASIEHNGRRITEIFIGDEKLTEEKWYRVAASDYLQRGTEYTALANNRNAEFRKEFIRDTLREYMSKQEFVENAFASRWVLKRD